MGSITAALRSSANALDVFSQTFGALENNIANSNTPGYARQDISLEALSFDPAGGLAGGVESGGLINSRSEYLDQAVRNQQQILGTAQQRAGDLSQVEALFDLTSDSGVAGAIDKFFNSFSQLSVNPSDAVSRQTVIASAGQLARNIRQSAAGITQVAVNAASQTGAVISQVNQLASEIARINQQFQSSPQALHDEGLDTQMHTALETLSQLVNFTMLKSGDGSTQVLIGGQEPLVLGASAFPVSVASTSQQTSILDSNGKDITLQITQGQLGALLGEQNTMLPGYLASLNTLAQSLADTVNGQLAQGVDANGAAGAPLFSYNQASDAGSTLAVTGTLPDQIAAASADAPGGNGNAIAMAQLASAPAVNGFTFTQFYGNLGAQVGTDVSDAAADHSQAQGQLTQAQTQRSNQTGVSLNEQAAELLQFQQAYSAVGKLVSVLDGLTTTIMNMVQP